MKRNRAAEAHLAGWLGQRPKKLVVRGGVVVGVISIVCILHASSARSEELCLAEAEPSPAAPSKPGACPADMVEIDGDFCPFLDQICIKRPVERSYRCSLYQKSSACQTGTAHQHFCIDTYEWPNKAGEQPTVMKDWYQAKAACEGLGKRLCTQDEWTQACEGPEHLPYPYGYARDATACNIDKPHPDVDEKALNNPQKRDAEVARLWQGEASGARERCVSPYGVHDMTGNVDEWVVNPSGKPHNSALKGGYWSYARARCRAVTPGHEEGFRYYQIGWRCCANPRIDGVSAPAVVAKRTLTGTSAAPPAAQAKAEPARSAAPPPPPPPVASPPPPPPPVVVRAPPPPPPPPPKVEEPRDQVRGPQKGAIDVPMRAEGHRVFVDGKVAAQGPKVIVVDCGEHVVRIGHDGRDQSIDVPCGGRVTVQYP